MAIDPKLVSIIPASDLPTGDPTSAGEFFFFEGNEMQKAPMTNIYDKVTSGITGEATQSNAPGSVGFERWIVSTPLTLPNSWGFAVTSEELETNNVFFNVTDGVVSKDSQEKRMPTLTTVLDPLNETDAVNGKAVGDYVYNETDVIVADKFDLITPPTIETYSDEAFPSTGTYSTISNRVVAHTNIVNQASRNGFITNVKIDCTEAGTVILVIGTLANFTDAQFFIRKEIGTFSLVLGVNDIVLNEPISAGEFVAINGGTSRVGWLHQGGVSTGNKFLTPYTTTSQPWATGQTNRPMSFGVTIAYTNESPLKIKLDERYQRIVEEDFEIKKRLTQINVSKEVNGNNAIQNALDSIIDNSPNNRYQINVANGIYEIFNGSEFLGNPTYPGMIVPKDHVDIIGTSKSSTIVSASLPYLDADIDVPITRIRFQTIYNWANDVLIKNFTFIGKNLRYVLHQDNGNEANGTRTYENCDFIWRGNKGYLRALGIGTYSGSKTFVIGGKSSAQGRAPFTIHNNIDFAKPSLWSFKNHFFENLTGTDSNVNGNGLMMGIENDGSMQDCTIELNGVDSNQFRIDYSDVWLYSVNKNDCFNYANWRIVGSGNRPMFFNNKVQGKALMIKSLSTGLNSKVRVLTSSSAYTALISNPYNYWGVLGHPERFIVDKYVAFDGAVGLNGYAIGGKSIMEGSAGNGVAYQTSLGKRLGNCEAVNKTLGINIDGTNYSVVFDKDYTAMSNSVIIAEINTVIGAVGVASEYNIGGDYHAEFSDVLFEGVNASTTTFIPKGTLVAMKNNRLSICGENDVLFGLLIDDCAPYRLDSEGVVFGKGRVIRNCYITSEIGKLQSVVTSGSGVRYKVVNGAFTADNNGSYILENGKYFLI